MTPTGKETVMEDAVRLTNRCSVRPVGRIVGVLGAALAASFSAILPPLAEASAQDLSVRAYADPPEVEVGEQFRLVVEVTGARTVDSVAAPDWSGLRQNVTGYESRDNPWRPVIDVKVGDGQVEGSSNSVTVTYLCVARQVGSVEVGPFRILADGDMLETEPVMIRSIAPGRSEVVVQVSIEPARARVGENIELSAEVFGLGPGPHEFISPDVFDFADIGSLFRHGNEMSWRLGLTRPGEFVIPPVRVVDSEVTYESESITLVVEEPVEVRTELESGSIWVGGEFVLRLEVMGVAELDEEPASPETADFAELLELEERSRDFMTKSVDRVYRFRALQEGRFEIGPLRVAAAGQSLETGPIELTIDEMPTGAPDAPAALFFMALGRSRAFVGEPVVVAYEVAHDNLFFGPVIGTKSWPAFEGFEVVELNPWRSRRRTFVDGRRYDSDPVRRVALRPLRDGQLDVGIATLEARVRRPLHYDGFTSYILTSDPLAIEVLPLPEEGRPGSFRGHVGTLDVVSWVDRTRVEVGERVTLQVEVSVGGLLEDLADPDIEFPVGFAVAETEIDSETSYRRTDLRGSRTHTYHLTATTPGTYVIPAVEMSYFDPETESYGTTRSYPFTVTVVPAGGEVR
ncbi:MAG: BatD family protein [Gemmatimonadota bacterium]|nr:BatD family protein [Gemmatimonadota bacterium]